MSDELTPSAPMSDQPVELLNVLKGAAALAVFVFLVHLDSRRRRKKPKQE